MSGYHCIHDGYLQSTHWSNVGSLDINFLCGMSRHLFIGVILPWTTLGDAYKEMLDYQYIHYQ